MNWENINLLAIVAAALATFVIGGLWYSPLLFGRAWMRANNFTEEQVQQFSKGRMFGFSLLFALIMSFNLAVFLSNDGTDWVWGMTAGALAGLGWVALSIAIVALFEGRSWSYIFINGGYNVAAFVVMGLILGAWR